MSCTVEDLIDRFDHLIATQYGGITAAILDEAVETGLPVSFAIYPDDTGSAACEAQYELDLYRIKAESLHGFAERLAQSTYDKYVSELGVDMDAEDIACVDIIS